MEVIESRERKQSNKGVEVYPNPAQSELNIILPQSLSDDAQMTIYSSRGEVIGTHRLKKGLNTIQLSPALIDGLYILRINGEDGLSFVKKVVIHRHRLLNVEEGYNLIVIGQLHRDCINRSKYVSLLQIVRMAAKLTLSLNKSIIEKAKKYAKGNNQSLSQIIESYLDKITSENPELGDSELDSIRGIIKLPKDFDLKEESRKLRINKHG